MTGASAILLEHVRRLTLLGWNVDVFGERIDRVLIREAGGTPHRVTRPLIGKYLSRRFFAMRFDHFVERRVYDLVIGHGDVFNQHVVLVHNLLRREAEIVNKGKLRELKPLIKMHDELLSRQRFRLCIANSRLMKQDLCARYRVPAGRIEVVYPGFDPARFCSRGRDTYRHTVRQELGVIDAIVIGFITSGRLIKRGFDILLQTLSLLDQRTLDKTKVLVVGSSREARRLVEPRFTDLYRRHVVIVEPTKEVERLYHALDIFFHPARLEEFGLVVQEAAACGLPVLTSRQVGAAELLGETSEYSVIDQPDAALFAARLRELIGDAALRARCAAQAQRAFANNTWERHFDRFMRTCDEHRLLPN